MTTSQSASGTSPLPSRAARGIALRIACCLSTAFLLYGCTTTPTPLTPMPSDESPPVIARPSAPITEKITPAMPEEETRAPLSEESNIFFPVRSAMVSDTGKEKLRLHADRLKLDRKEAVLLVGHSDDQGSRNYNLAITEERLMAVEKLLRNYGVSLRQIRRNRSGSVKTSPPCTTSECRQQMRRVELVYSR